MDRTFAFVDESGNADLGTSKIGSSGFFIVCSILVAKKNFDWPFFSIHTSALSGFAEKTFFAYTPLSILKRRTHGLHDASRHALIFKLRVTFL